MQKEVNQRDRDSGMRLMARNREFKGIISPVCSVHSQWSSCGQQNDSNLSIYTGQHWWCCEVRPM